MNNLLKHPHRLLNFQNSSYSILPNRIITLYNMHISKNYSINTPYPGTNILHLTDFCIALKCTGDSQNI